MGCGGKVHAGEAWAPGGDSSEEEHPREQLNILLENQGSTCCENANSSVISQTSHRRVKSIERKPVSSFLVAVVVIGFVCMSVHGRPQLTLCFPQL